jgi:adenine deaminase
MPTRKAAYRSPALLAEMIRVARGEQPADLVVRGAEYLDVFTGACRRGDVAVHQGVIAGVAESYQGQTVIDGAGAMVVPGFIDAHVHIESSLMTPVRFQQAVLPCGTTSVIWDPHEIANVRGADGIAWALRASEGLDLDVFVMVPSCVPSTSPAAGLETSGAVLTARDLAPFRGHPRVLGLAEMMNFPGLLGGDGDVLSKLVDFEDLRRDGHCPGLTGKDLNAYGVAGIHSCHESTTLPEAAEKLGKGIHVLIREGSCAKDADALLPLLTAYSSACIGLCSDDRNPADIAEAGHISCIVDKGLRRGLAPEAVFRAASYGPARLYGLDDRGAVAPGYAADLVLVEPRAGSWANGLRIRQVLKRGRAVDGATLEREAMRRQEPAGGRNLHLPPATPATFRLPVRGDGPTAARVIGVIPRQILTQPLTATVLARGGALEADPSQDVLKIAVLERHHGSGGGAVAFVRGFRLKRGAIATSINHDSHNVIAVGSDDQLLAAAVNRLREIDGGIVVVTADGRSESLPLPLGGLMTGASPEVVTAALHRLKALAQAAGCELEEPFLQLSFLALPVIPTLKISDKGLVDVGAFKLVSVAI